MKNKPTSALVPLATGFYASPLLRKAGKPADLGLLAEALLYYDIVHVHLSSPQELALLILWFRAAGKLDHLIAMIQSGTIQFIYEDAQLAVWQPIEVKTVDGTFDGPVEWTRPIGQGRVVGPIQFSLSGSSANDRFAENILRPAIEGDPFSTNKQKHRFTKAVREHVTVASIDFMQTAAEAASADAQTPALCAVLVEELLDEVLGYDSNRQVTAVNQKEPSGATRITYNIGFEEATIILGSELPPPEDAPFLALGYTNRLLASAALVDSDLVLPNPAAGVASHKLAACVAHIDKFENILQELILKVEFPDIRALVNGQKIDACLILEMRKRAAPRFRGWIHQEAELDRDAVIAYHNEVSQDSGFTKTGRTLLHLFGELTGTSTGWMIGHHVAGMPGAIIGAFVGERAKSFVGRIADKNKEWKPVIFGNWARSVVKEKSADIHT